MSYSTEKQEVKPVSTSSANRFGSLQNPNADGFYGELGGAFIPEMLYPNVEELRNN